jgi:hypothetical protein
MAVTKNVLAAGKDKRCVAVFEAAVAQVIGCKTPHYECRTYRCFSAC